jgi:hypothetical protein
MLLRAGHIRNKIFSDIVSGDEVRRNDLPTYKDLFQDLPMHTAPKSGR